MRVNHLSIGLDEDFPTIKSPLLGDGQYRSVYGGEGFLPEDAFIYCGSFVISNAVFSINSRIDQTKKWLRAGPRKTLYFEPTQVKVPRRFTIRQQLLPAEVSALVSMWLFASSTWDCTITTVLRRSLESSTATGGFIHTTGSSLTLTQ